MPSKFSLKTTREPDEFTSKVLEALGSQSSWDRHLDEIINRVVFSGKKEINSLLQLLHNVLISSEYDVHLKLSAMKLADTMLNLNEECIEDVVQTKILGAMLHLANKKKPGTKDKKSDTYFQSKTSPETIMQCVDHACSYIQRWGMANSSNQSKEGKEVKNAWEGLFKAGVIIPELHVTETQSASDRVEINNTSIQNITSQIEACNSCVELLANSIHNSDMKEIERNTEQAKKLKEKLEIIVNTAVESGDYSVLDQSSTAIEALTNMISAGVDILTESGYNSSNLLSKQGEEATKYESRKHGEKQLQKKRSDKDLMKSSTAKASRADSESTKSRKMKTELISDEEKSKLKFLSRSRSKEKSEYSSVDKKKHSSTKGERESSSLDKRRSSRSPQAIQKNEEKLLASFDDTDKGKKRRDHHRSSTSKNVSDDDNSVWQPMMNKTFFLKDETESVKHFATADTSLTTTQSDILAVPRKKSEKPDLDEFYKVPGLFETESSGKNKKKGDSYKISFGGSSKYDSSPKMASDQVEKKVRRSSKLKTRDTSPNELPQTPETIKDISLLSGFDGEDSLSSAFNFKTTHSAFPVDQGFADISNITDFDINNASFAPDTPFYNSDTESKKLRKTRKSSTSSQKHSSNQFLSATSNFKQTSKKSPTGEAQKDGSSNFGQLNEMKITEAAKDTSKLEVDTSLENAIEDMSESISKSSPIKKNRIKTSKSFKSFEDRSDGNRIFESTSAEKKFNTKSDTSRRGVEDSKTKLISDGSDSSFHTVTSEIFDKHSFNSSPYGSSFESVQKISKKSKASVLKAVKHKLGVVAGAGSDSDESSISSKEKSVRRQKKDQALEQLTENKFKSSSNEIELPAITYDYTSPHEDVDKAEKSIEGKDVTHIDSRSEASKYLLNAAEVFSTKSSQFDSETMSDAAKLQMCTSPSSTDSTIPIKIETERQKETFDQSDSVEIVGKREQKKRRPKIYTEDEAYDKTFNSNPISSSQKKSSIDSILSHHSGVTPHVEIESPEYKAKFFSELLPIENCKDPDGNEHSDAMNSTSPEFLNKFSFSKKSGTIFDTNPKDIPEFLNTIPFSDQDVILPDLKKVVDSEDSVGSLNASIKSATLNEASSIDNDERGVSQQIGKANNLVDNEEFFSPVLGPKLEMKRLHKENDDDECHKFNKEAESKDTLKNEKDEKPTKQSPDLTKSNHKFLSVDTNAHLFSDSMDNKSKSFAGKFATQELDANKKGSTLQIKNATKFTKIDNNIASLKKLELKSNDTHSMHSEPQDLGQQEMLKSNEGGTDNAGFDFPNDIQDFTCNERLKSNEKKDIGLKSSAQSNQDEIYDNSEDDCSISRKGILFVNQRDESGRTGLNTSKDGLNSEGMQPDIKNSRKETDTSTSLKMQKESQLSYIDDKTNKHSSLQHHATVDKERIYNSVAANAVYKKDKNVLTDSELRGRRNTDKNEMRENYSAPTFGSPKMSWNETDYTSKKIEAFSNQAIKFEDYTAFAGAFHENVDEAGKDSSPDNFISNTRDSFSMSNTKNKDYNGSKPLHQEYHTSASSSHILERQEKSNAHTPDNVQALISSSNQKNEIAREMPSAISVSTAPNYDVALKSSEYQDEIDAPSPSKQFNLNSASFSSKPLPVKTSLVSSKLVEEQSDKGVSRKSDKELFGSKILQFSTPKNKDIEQPFSYESEMRVTSTSSENNMKKKILPSEDSLKTGVFKNQPQEQEVMSSQNVVGFAYPRDINVETSKEIKSDVQHIKAPYTPLSTNHKAILNTMISNESNTKKVIMLMEKQIEELQLQLDNSISFNTFRDSTLKHSSQLKELNEEIARKNNEIISLTERIFLVEESNKLNQNNTQLLIDESKRLQKLIDGQNNELCRTKEFSNKESTRVSELTEQLKETQIALIEKNNSYQELKSKHEVVLNQLYNFKEFDDALTQNDEGLKYSMFKKAHEGPPNSLFESSNFNINGITDVADPQLHETAHFDGYAYNNGLEQETCISINKDDKNLLTSNSINSHLLNDSTGMLFTSTSSQKDNYSQEPPPINTQVADLKRTTQEYCASMLHNRSGILQPLEEETILVHDKNKNVVKHDSLSIEKREEAQIWKPTLLPDDMSSKSDASTMHQFRELLQCNESVLFEDELIQIGISSKYSGIEGLINIYYGNKSNGVLHNVSCAISSPATAQNLQLRVGNIPDQIFTRSQVVQEVHVHCLAPFLGYPLFRVQFLLPDNTPRVINLRLPLAVTKFMSAKLLRKDEFFGFWDSEIFNNNEVASCSMINSKFQSKMPLIYHFAHAGGALAVCPQVDLKADRLVMAGIFPAEGNNCNSVPVSLCLAKIDIGTGHNKGKIQYAVRSDNPQLSKSVHSVLYTLISI